LIEVICIINLSVTLAMDLLTFMGTLKDANRVMEKVTVALLDHVSRGMYTGKVLVTHVQGEDTDFNSTIL